MRPLRLLLLLGCLLPGVQSGTKPGFYLHDGDTVVFYGDSITDHRLYTTFVETFVLTRFPQLHVRFINSGWGGDRVSGGGGGPIDLRLRRDVLAYRPTVMTIMLGMNDAEYQPYSPEIFEKFAAGYRHILETVRTELPNLRITLLEPSAYDDVTHPPEFAGGYNSVLVRYGQFVRGLANQPGLAVADLNAPVVALLTCSNKVDPRMALHMIPDRVHPSQGVNMVMTEALLKAWHAPAIVTAVAIDASAGKVLQADRTTVEAVDTTAGVSWTQLDRALPMPVETEEDSIRLAVRCSDFTQALNQQPLKVIGLDEGSYTLRIDDETVGSFTSVQLQKGINLATLPTPMAKQAANVRLLTFRRGHLHYANERFVETSLREYHPTHLDAAVSELDALESEVRELQTSMAQPKLRRYQLRRQ